MAEAKMKIKDKSKAVKEVNKKVSVLALSSEESVTYESGTGKHTSEKRRA